MSIPNKYLEALGRINVNHAHLEFEIFFLIGSLSSADQQAARIISEQLTFRGKYRLIRELCKLRIADKKKIKEAESLVKELEKVGKERNSLIHSTWASGDGAEILSCQREGVVEVKLEDLKRLGNRLTEASRLVRRFNGKLRAWFPGLLEAHRDPWGNQAQYE